MNEYFIVAHSFAAPFVSETTHEHVAAYNPVEALSRFRRDYDHFAGLHSATCYASEDAMLNGARPLIRYLADGRSAEGRAA